MLIEEDVTEAMRVPCFGDIGYCCALEQACLWRDSGRQASGMNAEVCAEAKEAVVSEILQGSGKKETRT